MNIKDRYQKKIEEIIRVDHAGEYGAIRIYDGQLRALALNNNMEILAEVNHMREQEEGHLEFFNKMLIERKTLSTIFLPIWHYIGYGLGYFSAKMGEDFAMSCTKAVEETIDQHYQEQIIELKALNENELADKIEIFRLEELEHRDYAVDHNMHYYQSPLRVKAINLFERSVKIGCKIAIFISKKF